MYRLAVVTVLCTPVFSTALAAAQPSAATSYAIFSTSNVELQSYSTVLGQVYAGGNLKLHSGYGIQRPAANAGNMYAIGDFSEDGTSQINGSVFTNHDLTLLSTAKISGTATFGNSYFPSGSNTISGGAHQQANSVAAQSLPAATSFSPGFFDAIHTGDFTLAPGSYGAVTENGSFKSVHLSSGNYYLNSLSLLNATSLYLDFNGLQPINIYVNGDIYIDSGFNVFVNGVEVGNGNNGLQTGYAGLTLFETHGNFTIGSGFLNYFYGTIFAPSGSVTMNVQDMFGSILASGPINGNVYIDQRTSQALAVPEPSSALLLIAGGALLIGLRVRRR